MLNTELLNEIRYEIKDHLGNVRAVTSDIKNASNYNLVASSWKFLADVQNLNNFYPYGLNIDEGTWSKSSYKFSYNGKQEETFDKDYLDYGARTFDRKKITFIKTDDIERHFPSFSPYSYANNNPIALIDFNGYAAKWNPWHLGKKDWWILDGLDAYFSNFNRPGHTYENAALYNSSLLNAREYKSIASKHAWYNWANYYVNKTGINSKWFSASANIVSPFQAGALDVNISMLDNYNYLKELALNDNTNNFLYNVANAVQKFNMNLINEINSKGTINGSTGGFENDLNILAQEQTIVQGVIDKLGDIKEEVMSDYNKAFGLVTEWNPIGGDYLKLAQTAVGGPLDFGNYKHRLAIGSAALRLQYGMDTSPNAINGDVQKMTETKPEKKD